MMLRLIFALILSVTITSPALAAIDNLPQVEGTTINGVAAGDYFGESIINAGDMTGDFFPDVAISARAYPQSSKLGSVYIFKGRPEGFPQTLNTTEAIRVVGAKMNAWLGEVVKAGRINDDRLSDLVISSASGEVDIIWGSEILPQQISAADIGTKIPGVKLRGWRVDSIAIGDINGDGKNDLLLSPGPNGQIGIIYNQTLAQSGILELNDSLFDGVRAVRVNAALMGQVVRLALTDYNKDGIKDIAFVVSNTRLVTVIKGRSDFPANVNSDDSYLANGLRGFRIDTNFATHIFNAGDMNADGVEDLFLRGSMMNSSTAVNGLVFLRTDQKDIILRNTFSAPSPNFNGTVATEIRGIGVQSSSFGNSVVPVADRNGDGTKELAIGDPGYSSQSGRVVVVAGRKIWPGILNYAIPNGVDSWEIRATGSQYSLGASVDYAENLFGGIGCNEDVSYLFGAPRYGTRIGNAYIFNVKR